MCLTYLAVFYFATFFFVFFNFCYLWWRIKLCVYNPLLLVSQAPTIMSEFIVSCTVADDWLTCHCVYSRFNVLCQSVSLFKRTLYISWVGMRWSRWLRWWKWWTQLQYVSFCLCSTRVLTSDIYMYMALHKSEVNKQNDNDNQFSWQTLKFGK